MLSKSCHIAIRITEGDDREIIGFMIQNEEVMTHGPSLNIKELASKEGTELIISDAHKGPEMRS